MNSVGLSLLYFFLFSEHLVEGSVTKDITVSAKVFC